jgi:hypothetical protein
MYCVWMYACRIFAVDIAIFEEELNLNPVGFRICFGFENKRSEQVVVRPSK